MKYIEDCQLKVCPFVASKECSIPPCNGCYLNYTMNSKTKEVNETDSN